MEIEKKILIVDDKPENLVALEKLLQYFKVTLIRALSGNEALTLTLEHDFALALIDVQMPDMDGYETVKLMRNVDKTRLLPVIFISAIYSENHYLIQGIEAGAVDFIAKPIQPRIILGKVKIFLDLFEQKKILEFEIAQRVQTERSLLEAEKELKIAKNKAEETDRLKTAFLANMSHEIRTPLNAIVGFSNLLAIGELTKEKRTQFASYINNSSASLTSIINDIIDIAKIESEQLQIEFSPCNINELLFELYNTISAELKNRNKEHLEFKINIPNPKSLFVIETDILRLRQILINLLINALKFTLEGSIEFGYNLINNQLIEFYVRDTGIGIPFNKQQTVFDRFHQIKSEKVHNVSGTGLGLSIVKKLSELLGGNIRLESEEMVGSIFYVTIPNKKPTEQYNSIPHTAVTSSKIEYKWPNKAVIIAEDEYYNYSLLNALLSETSVNIIWAKNGLEAVNNFKENQHVNLVLLDIKMPTMTGFEAFTEIREINKSIPIIAQTAYAMTGEKEYCLKLGFNEYITKPFSREELLNLLNGYLK